MARIINITTVSGYQAAVDLDKVAGVKARSSYGGSGIRIFFSEASLNKGKGSDDYITSRDHTVDQFVELMKSAPAASAKKTKAAAPKKAAKKAAAKKAKPKVKAKVKAKAKTKAKSKGYQSAYAY